MSLVISGYEARQNDQWKHTRQIAYLIYQLGTDSKDRESITGFMPLPTDTEQEDSHLSRREKLIQRMQERGVIPKK